MSCAGHGRRHVKVGYRKPIVEYCDDDDDDDDDESVRQLLIDNDPQLTGYVAYLLRLDRFGDEEEGYTFEEFELELSKAISANTHLRYLEVNYPSPFPYDEELMRVLQLFFKGFVRNRSIEHLVWYHDRERNIDSMASMLATFIEHNQKLRCIEIIGTDDLILKRGCRCQLYQSLASVLIPKISNKNRLERINLSDNFLEDNMLVELMDALRVTPGLHNLLDLCLGGNAIRVGGCTALRNLLTTSECSIQVLDLERSYDLDDDGMDILVDGLAQNDTVLSLNVAWLDAVTSRCWTKFSKKYLSKKANNTDDYCSLKRIWLGKNDIKTACCSSLGRAFTGMHSLQVLDLCGTASSITPTRWQYLTKTLTLPTCIISELYLDSCTGSINDTGAAVIFSALANNKSLKILSMEDNKSITANGWKAGFQALLESQHESNLSSLLLSNNDINNEGVTILVDWVATGASTVTQLELGQLYTNNDIPAITENGWCTVADALLPRSTSKLQSLRVGSNLSDDAATCLFHALAENSSLVTLTMTFAGLGFERSCWEVLAKVLCDNSSFDSICNSNHTLEEVKVREEYSDVLQYRIADLLRMNEDENKSEVLREKLLQFHFSDSENVSSVFGSMETKLLPHAVAWIGRDRLGYGVMYKLFHDMPWLCSDCRTYEPSKKIRRVR